MANSRPTILIADDTPATILVLESILSKDHEIMVAKNGKEAVAIAIAGRPDLILLDVMMPEMNGFEACLALKSDTRTSDIPVIFVTSLQSEEEETIGLEMGAIDFISKPFSPPVVRARVRNHLELKLKGDLLAGFSFMDGLTGLANRRRLDQYLDTEWRRCLRARTPLGLVLLDIDHFKTFNDLAGHLAGDDCLRKLGGLLAGTAQRAGDLVARYGGEEFMCVLPGTDLRGAFRLAERIQLALAHAALPHPGSPVSPYVTVSEGVAAMVPEPGSLATSLVEAADRALYAAKHQGRDRVVPADPVQASPDPSE